MPISKSPILVTGAAGFIGACLTIKLLEMGEIVVGIDNLNDYYDIKLKQARLTEIKKQNGEWKFHKISLEDNESLKLIFKTYKPKIVVNLAAQAGVRYSIENPKSYLNANIIGTFNILELIKIYQIKHTLIASTSSVYGANKDMPFKESQKTENQISFYAATKKACEVLSHSYSHIHNLPITNFRFFTVYGPWGRPDMALFKFVKGIKEKQPIDIYNHGQMKRDFTYIDDLVKGIFLLTKCIPEKGKHIGEYDSLSPVAPWRIVNIGNSKVENLMNFVEEIESTLNCKAIKNYLPMQAGDVKETFADTNLLTDLTGFKPNTSIKYGIKEFCNWYQNYYK